MELRLPVSQCGRKGRQSRVFCWPGSMAGSKRTQLPKCTILIYFTIPKLLINLAAPTTANDQAQMSERVCVCVWLSLYVHMLVGLFEHHIRVGYACGRACNLNNEDILLIQEIQLACLKYEPHTHPHTHIRTYAHTHAHAHTSNYTERVARTLSNIRARAKVSVV